MAAPIADTSLWQRSGVMLRCAKGPSAVNRSIRRVACHAKLIPIRVPEIRPPVISMIFGAKSRPALIGAVIFQGQGMTTINGGSVGRQ
jgi:hypothetical protein